MFQMNVIVSVSQSVKCIDMNLQLSMHSEIPHMIHDSMTLIPAEIKLRMNCVVNHHGIMITWNRHRPGETDVMRASQEVVTSSSARKWSYLNSTCPGSFRSLSETFLPAKTVLQVLCLFWLRILSISMHIPQPLRNFFSTSFQLS